MKNCNVKGILFCIPAFLLLLTPLSAQKNRKDLEAQRKQLESQIKATTDILSKTEKDKSLSLRQLKSLNAQILQRQELLASIKSELEAVSMESSQKEKERLTTEEEIAQWENRLSSALRNAYIRSQIHPDWIYLLSAPTLGEAMARWVYLRQYKSYVLRQWNALRVRHEKLRSIIRVLEENKRDKAMLFETEDQQRKSILDQQKNKEKLVNELSREEKKLRSQLAATQEKRKNSTTRSRALSARNPTRSPLPASLQPLPLLP